MRRTRLVRGLAGLLSIWLAICLAEPMQLHTCVMHGGLAINPSMGVAMHGGLSHGSRDGAASAHTIGGHSHHDQGTDTQSKQCTCLGDCSSGRNPVTLAAAETQVVSIEIEVPRAAFSYDSPSLVSPHFLLPFSNGPPGTSSRA